MIDTRCITTLIRHAHSKSTTSPTNATRWRSLTSSSSILCLNVALSVMKMSFWHMHTEHTKTHKRSYWLTTSMPLSFLILYQHAWSTSRLLQVVAFLGWNGRRRLEPQGYSQALAFEEIVHDNLQDGDVATLLVLYSGTFWETTLTSNHLS